MIATAASLFPIDDTLLTRVESLEAAADLIGLIARLLATQLESLQDGARELGRPGALIAEDATFPLATLALRLIGNQADAVRAVASDAIDARHAIQSA